MVWSGLLAVTVAALLDGARADPEWTLQNVTRPCFSPELTYSDGWTPSSSDSRDHATSSTESPDFDSMSTSGGSVTVDFVGSGIYVYGSLDLSYDADAGNGTVPTITLRMDHSDVVYVESGVKQAKNILLTWARFPPGRHTVEIASTQGYLSITNLGLTLGYPVSEDTYRNATIVDYQLTTTDPFAIKSAVTTTGEWSAVAQEAGFSYDDPRIATTEAGASFSLSLGKGNHEVAVWGYLGVDLGAYRVNIDPAPYLSPASFQSVATFPIPKRLATQQLYSAPLEPSKEYTIKVTNMAGDPAAPGLQVVFVRMRKERSLVRGWNPTINNTNVGTPNKTDEGADKPEPTKTDEGAAKPEPTSDDKKSGSSSSINVAAVAGGVVGGFTGLAVAIFFYMRRKRRLDWEASRDVGGQLDLSGSDDYVTPFTPNAPSAQHLQSPSGSHGTTEPGLMVEKGQGLRADNRPSLGLASSSASSSVGPLPANSSLPIDQPAPRLPQETDAGPRTTGTIPPSYDPSWAEAANSRLSTATSNDPALSAATSNDASSQGIPGYEPNLSAMEELNESAGGSSSQPPPAPASSWPQDRKNPRDFQQ